MGLLEPLLISNLLVALEVTNIFYKSLQCHRIDISCFFNLGHIDLVFGQLAHGEDGGGGGGGTGGGGGRREVRTAHFLSSACLW